LLDCDTTVQGAFTYDFPRMFADGGFADPEAYRLDAPITFLLTHDRDQRETIRGYVGQYGTTLAGLGRVLMKVPIHRIFRSGDVSGADGELEPPSQLVVGRRFSSSKYPVVLAKAGTHCLVHWQRLTEKSRRLPIYDNDLVGWQ